jgi:3-isopropylmalate dehydrogenase
MRRASEAGKVCSVDKANVLETSRLWREVMTAEGRINPDIELTHMYVDNLRLCSWCATRSNSTSSSRATCSATFLSDEASMLPVRSGMLPSASLDANNKGLYEPIHGSAPDIAGKGVANPLATILSAALMLRHSLNQGAAAQRLERAVKQTLRDGYRTADIYTAGYEEGKHRGNGKGGRGTAVSQGSGHVEDRHRRLARHGGFGTRAEDARGKGLRPRRTRVFLHLAGGRQGSRHRQGRDARRQREPTSTR